VGDRLFLSLWEARDHPYLRKRWSHHPFFASGVSTGVGVSFFEERTQVEPKQSSFTLEKVFEVRIVYDWALIESVRYFSSLV